MKWHLDELYEFINKNIYLIEQDALIVKELKTTLLDHLNQFLKEAESEESSYSKQAELMKTLKKITSFLLSVPHLVEPCYQKLLRMARFYSVNLVSGKLDTLGLSYSTLFEDNALYFELNEEGYRLYAASVENLGYLKQNLEDFNFKNIGSNCVAAGPLVEDFEKHTQYLLMPHREIGRLLSIFYRTENPEKYLAALYKEANLNPEKCRLYDARSAAFQEQDRVFYKSYFKKIKAFGRHSFLNQFKEDDNWPRTDFRRYVGPLYDLHQDFLLLSEEAIEILPETLVNLLNGLTAILICPEWDEEQDIAVILSRQIHQIYKKKNLNPPMVMFEEAGCSFYFMDDETFFKAAIQLELHGIKGSSFFDVSRPAGHKVPAIYTRCLTIPVNLNADLLTFARISSEKIVPILTKAYADQGIEYTKSLPESSKPQAVQLDDAASLARSPVKFKKGHASFLFPLHKDKTGEPSEAVPTVDKSWLLCFLMNEIALQKVKYGGSTLTSKAMRLDCVLSWMINTKAAQQTPIESILHLVHAICAVKYYRAGFQEPESLGNFTRLCIEKSYLLPKKPVLNGHALGQLTTADAVGRLIIQFSAENNCENSTILLL